MAKFFGVIGYGENEQTAPGVWQDVIVEKEAYGDVRRNGRQLVQAPRRISPTGEVNDDIEISNTISVVADAYAIEHYFAIRYLKWAGVRWIVKSITVVTPRLELTLGGVYNGPTPRTPDTAGGPDGRQP